MKANDIITTAAANSSTVSGLGDFVKTECIESRDHVMTCLVEVVSWMQCTPSSEVPALQELYRFLLYIRKHSLYGYSADKVCKRHSRECPIGWDKVTA